MEKGEIEEIKRYFEVVAEGLRSEIRQAAEGHQVLVDGQARINDFDEDQRLHR